MNRWMKSVYRSIKSKVTEVTCNHDYVTIVYNLDNNRLLGCTKCCKVKTLKIKHK